MSKFCGTKNMCLKNNLIRYPKLYATALFVQLKIPFLFTTILYRNISTSHSVYIYASCKCGCKEEIVKFSAPCDKILKSNVKVQDHVQRQLPKNETIICHCSINKFNKNDSATFGKACMNIHQKHSICKNNNTKKKNFIKNCLDHISGNSQDFENLVKLCSIASQNGDIETIRKIQKLAYHHHLREFRKSLYLQPYLAGAEFHAGLHSEALYRIADLYQLSQVSKEKNNAASASQCVSDSNEKPLSHHCSSTFPLFSKSLPSVGNHKKLKDTTCLLLVRVPNIDKPTLWDQADHLVDLLIQQWEQNRPAYTLWRSYFLSPLHPEFERADALLATHRSVRSYLHKYMPAVLQHLLQLHHTPHVHHLLLQLLKHNMHQRLQPVTSLLLTMHCYDGDVTAALETLYFARDLNLVLTYNSLLRLQQLLHVRQMPAPLHLLDTKRKAAAQPRLPPPPYKF